MKKTLFKVLLFFILIFNLVGCDFILNSPTTKEDKTINKTNENKESETVLKTLPKESKLSDWINLLRDNYTVDYKVNIDKEITKSGVTSNKTVNYQSTSYCTKNYIIRDNNDEVSGYILKDEFIYYLTSTLTYGGNVVYYPYSICVKTDMSYFTDINFNTNGFKKDSDLTYYLNFNGEKFKDVLGILPLTQALSLNSINKGSDSLEQGLINEVDGALITDLNKVPFINNFIISKDENDIIFNIEISYTASSGSNTEKDRGLITLRFYNFGITKAPNSINLIDEYKPESWLEAPEFAPKGIENITDPLNVPFIYPYPETGVSGYNSLRSEYITTGVLTSFKENESYVIILENTYLKDTDKEYFKNLVESKLNEGGFIYLESTIYNDKEVKWYYSSSTRSRVGYSYLSLFVSFDIPTNPLQAPVVSINKETGVASWNPVSGATGYFVKINSTTINTSELSATLEINDTIEVIAIGNEPYTSNSSPSIKKTYTKDSFVYSKDEIETYHSNNHINLLKNDTNGENMALFYNSLDDAIYEFFTTYSITLSTVSVEGEDMYIFDKFSYSDYSLSRDEAINVYQMYKADHPLYYFLDTTYITGNIGDNYYLAPVCSIEYIDGNYRKELNDNIIESLKNIVSSIESLNDYFKIRSIYKDVCDGMSYAYKNDGVTPEDEIWAHNIIGFFNEGKGVCESYSRTLSLILNAIDIDNYYVTGTSNGENHAWNMIKIDDAWYWADCTWDDKKILILYDWNYFLINDFNMYKDHLIDASLYKNLPERSETNYSPF